MHTSRNTMGPASQDHLICSQPDHLFNYTQNYLVTGNLPLAKAHTLNRRKHANYHRIIQVLRYLLQLKAGSAKRSHKIDCAFIHTLIPKTSWWWRLHNLFANLFQCLTVLMQRAALPCPSCSSLWPCPLSLHPVSLWKAWLHVPDNGLTSTRG